MNDTRSTDAPPPMTRCILCGTNTVEEFLDLGSTALANKFLSADALATPEPKFPLAVGFCHTCTHVQLTNGVPPQMMFEHYLYVSSASDTLVAHFDELSATLVERLGLNADDRVMDIGCNDGALLRAFRRNGLKALGVDPAANLATFTAGDDIDRHVGFFNARSADEIVARWGRQSLITATNTFPHIPLLDDFVAGILKVLAPGGAFVIEAHYLIDILDQLAFDTIYHEHISYWSLGPMVRLFERHGMQVVDAQRLPIHHGQIRVTVQRAGEGSVRPSVAAILEMERVRGLRDFATFEQFARDVQRVKEDLHDRLDDIRRDGGRVAAYGAPAKGNTLISFLDVGLEHIGYIADRSPLKQGLFTPGSHIPVVAPDRLLADQPDYVLLLAWNFLDEILPQQAEYRRRGGKFIVPLPKVAVV
jgi:SAM-dependent methyltransferase